MASVTVTRTIDAPVEKVWDLLADHGNVYTFHPGIESSSYLNKKAGKGGQRACEFGKGQGVNETIVAWQKHKLMTFEVTEIRKMPIKTMKGTFRIAGKGPTTVAFELDYNMKGGPLMNFMARGMMKKASVGMLDGVEKTVA